MLHELHLLLMRHALVEEFHGALFLLLYVVWVIREHLAKSAGAGTLNKKKLSLEKELSIGK